uniref:Chlorophyll a-b binding protein, chloroplastic n=1 Tax=Picocystis salinarum TaxID=88271 RepID=A0A7S3XDJ5_9CHLO|mmetsp:Transcript_7929/g.48979  ORF Transcript_7929/g.48979 Transcript_7929/m.48979 type:complete len:150 (+) Transcript_7929:3-452(+)
MLGWAGMMAAELEPNVEGGWKDAALWFRDGASPTYVGNDVPIPLASVVGIQALTMAIAERKRAQSDFELRKYPGGKFDVLGLADKLDLEDMKKKEIANGRVAMLACWGCVAQGFAIGGTPITNLTDHLADAGHNNIVGNGGIPWLLYGL